MRILIVSHEYPPIGGGGANACLFLSKEFANRGNKVDIVTVNYGNQMFKEERDGVTIYRLDCKRKNIEHCSFSEMLDYLVKAVPFSKRLHKRVSFDVCLVFFGIPSGPIGYLLKRKYGIPYIIRFGGGDVPGFQERFTFVYKILGPAIKRIWDSADALVANSNGLRKMALNYYNKNDFKVICNGIDTNLFCPSNDLEKKDFIQILFVSRLIERKGLQFIIPKLFYIREKAKTDIKLVVVGDGPYRETLEKLANDNNVSFLIKFVGQKDKSEIIRHYQESDLFIFPSKKEGMPNVVLEAMACGLPVIMTPCEGSEELIKGNGIIAEIDEFPDSIVRLINDETLRCEMGDISKRLANSAFSWSNAAGKYLDLMSIAIKDIISNKTL